MIAKVVSCWPRHWNSRRIGLGLFGLLGTLGTLASLELVAGVAGGSSVGCSEDPCSRANDLISQCATPDVTVPSLSQASMSLACTGPLLCQANCINAASCLEIEGLQCFNEISCAPITDGSVAKPLALCIEACSGEAGEIGDAGEISDAGEAGEIRDAGTD